MGLVSIIMPVYNVEKHLPRAIESALQQTNPNWELILVDDGSTDNSGNICEEYKKKDARIHVIYQENKGSGPARNAGLDRAQGDYIYFADPDDYFDSDLIEENLLQINEAGADAVVFGFYEEKTRGNERKEEKMPTFHSFRTQKEFRERFAEYYSFHPYALWNKMYKKSYLDEYMIRFTDQKLGQDALFNLEVIQNLRKAEVNPRLYYHYIQHEGSAVNRYRENRFELEYTIASHFEKVMTSWNEEEKYQSLSAKEYWNAVYLELVNLNAPACPLSIQKKIHRINNVLSFPRVEWMLQHYPIDIEENLFIRKLVGLLQQRKVRYALHLMEVRLFLEARFYPFFDWAKSSFSEKK